MTYQCLVFFWIQGPGSFLTSPIRDSPGPIVHGPPTGPGPNDPLLPPGPLGRLPPPGPHRPIRPNQGPHGPLYHPPAGMTGPHGPLPPNLPPPHGHPLPANGHPGMLPPGPMGGEQFVPRPPNGHAFRPRHGPGPGIDPRGPPPPHFRPPPPHLYGPMPPPPGMETITEFIQPSVYFQYIYQLYVDLLSLLYSVISHYLLSPTLTVQVSVVPWDYALPSLQTCASQDPVTTHTHLSICLQELCHHLLMVVLLLRPPITLLSPTPQDRDRTSPRSRKQQQQPLRTQSTQPWQSLKTPLTMIEDLEQPLAPNPLLPVH